MNFLNNVSTSISRDKSTSIRSHQSFDSQVEAICHHSGQYLTADEADHPIWKRLVTRLLKEQHDFPGLRRLDRIFMNAAHANEHQHIVWSRIAIRSIALLLPIPFLVIILLTLFRLQDFVPRQLWYFYLGALALFAFGCLLAVILGITQYLRRGTLFHNTNAGKPPMVIDYPLTGKYQIDVQEQIVINLDNVNVSRPQVVAQRGEIAVKLHTLAGQWEDYVKYCSHYRDHNVGSFVHGGAVALENPNNIRFIDDVSEFDHRIVLRVKAAEAGFNSTTSNFPAVTVKSHYEILPAALYPEHSGLPRFPLEIEPRLSPNDSRTLELRLSWRGPDLTADCRLDSCALNIPLILGRVVRVKLGRANHEKNQVVWRNRSFRRQNLVLSITFEKPVLTCHDLITGTYSFSYDGLLSNMIVSPKNVWNVLGRRMDKESCEINLKTIVSGSLTLGVQRLSQEHEYVQAMPPINCPYPPDENLVRAVTDVLLDEGFDLQRVTRSAPRLDPTGRLDKQLFYWDILGRQYIEDLLDSVDVHVVITGAERILQNNNSDELFQPYTNIDLRARCLHDPRNHSTPQAVDSLIGGSEEFSLAAKIKDAVEQAVGQDS